MLNTIKKSREKKTSSPALAAFTAGLALSVVVPLSSAAFGQLTPQQRELFARQQAQQMTLMSGQSTEDSRVESAVAVAQAQYRQAVNAEGVRQTGQIMVARSQPMTESHVVDSTLNAQASMTQSIMQSNAAIVASGNKTMASNTAAMWDGIKSVFHDKAELDKAAMKVAAAMAGG